jgi:hypothetical protein
MRIVCPNPNAKPPQFAPKRGPVSFTQTTTIQQFPTIAERNLDVYHQLWDELHDKQDPTPEWFADWVNRVPQASCGCQRWLAEYLKTNPPRYNDWYSWTVELHNAVNVKINKPIWSGLS